MWPDRLVSLSLQQLQALLRLPLADPFEGHQRRPVLPARFISPALPVVDRQLADADKARVVLIVTLPPETVPARTIEFGRND